MKSHKQKMVAGLDHPFNSLLTKLRLDVSNPQAYPNFQSLDNEIESISATMLTLRRDKDTESERKLNDAITLYFKNRLKSLNPHWDDHELFFGECHALQGILEHLGINNPEEEPKEYLFNKSVTHEIKKAYQVLVDRFMLICEKKDLLLNPIGNLKSAIHVLASHEKLNDGEASAIIKKQLIRPDIYLTDQYLFEHMVKPLSNIERERLKSRLIDFTLTEIDANPSQASEVYRDLFNQLTNAQANTPLIQILRMGRDGETDKPNKRFQEWLALMQNATSPAFIASRNKASAERKHALILEKLNPAMDTASAYTSFKELASDAQAINEITEQLGDLMNKSKLMNLRLALKSFIESRMTQLSFEWNELDHLSSELTALNEIQSKLSIIQPKPNPGNARTLAIGAIENAKETLSEKQGLIQLMNKLLGQEELKPDSAMLFLAKSINLPKEVINQIITKHLIALIDQSLRDNELSQLMKTLNDDERQLLKSRLIDFTDDIKPVSNNNPSPTYGVLLENSRKPDSLIPLIEILRIDSEGHSNAKTKSYKEWLKTFNPPAESKESGWLPGLFDKRLAKQKKKSHDKADRKLFDL